MKKNNRGFSLVEMIVVVAIMAVLMAVLVPTLVRQIEKSKRTKDLAAVGEVRQQVWTTLANADFSEYPGVCKFTGGKITITEGNFATVINEKFAQELKANLGVNEIVMSSREFKDADIIFYIERDTCYAEVKGTKGQVDIK